MSGPVRIGSISVKVGDRPITPSYHTWVVENGEPVNASFSALGFLASPNDAGSYDFSIKYGRAI